VDSLPSVFWVDDIVKLLLLMIFIQIYYLKINMVFSFTVCIRICAFNTSV